MRVGDGYSKEFGVEYGNKCSSGLCTQPTLLHNGARGLISSEFRMGCIF